MKSIAIRELHHRLKTVLAEVERGETVEIRRRNRPIARLVPLEPSGTPEQWPDLVGRLKSLYRRRISRSTASVIASDRGH